MHPKDGVGSGDKSMSKLTKQEKAEAAKMFAEMREWLLPHPKAVSLGEVTEKFCELANANDLIAEFEKRKWGREEFCYRHGCRKWVYDFLCDMTQIGQAKKHLEKSLASLGARQKGKTAFACVNSEKPLRTNDFNEPTMLVVINKWNPDDPQGQSLYDAARGYWYVGSSGKAYKCRYVVASYYGRVMEVYEINKAKSWQTWQQSPKKTKPNDRPQSSMRRAFEGHVVSDEIRAKYIGRSTSGLIRPRADKVYLGF